MTRVALVVAFLALVACVSQPRNQRGAACELNSQCDAPLVCRLAACRKECASARDCGIGQQCVLDPMGLGACTLESESHCAQTSECPASLVCASTHCVNACNEDRDCHGGAMCVDHGCVDPSANACIRDSECVGIIPLSPLHFVCTNDQRCRQECVSDRDCRFGTVCHPASHACVGRDQIPDGGLPDSSFPDGGTLDAGAPDAGPACMPGTPSTAVQISAGYHFTCALLRDQRVACWGANDRGQLGHAGAGASSTAPVIVDGIGDAFSISTGVTHACALRTTGEVWCWGDNTFGQLGDGTTTARASPVAVVGLSGALAVGAGASTTCAMNATSDVVCWGNGLDGALGDGTTTGMRLMPSATSIGIVGGASTLSVGSLDACVRPGAVTVSCWGQNFNGVTGTGTEYPVRVPTPTDVPIISGGSTCIDVVTRNSHSCALFAGRTLNCWGTNIFGELGLPVSAAHLSPVVVPGVADAIAVGVGDRFTCLIGRLHDVRCFGWNAVGELGDGTTTSRETSTTPVIGVASANAISVGNTHTCVLDGMEVYCWGSNSLGELGDGTTVDRHTAVHVECLP